MKLTKDKPTEQTPLSDAELAAQAYAQAQSLPQLQRARAKQAQIYAEYAAKVRECDELRNRFLSQRNGRRVDETVSRILESPLDEPLFDGGPEFDLIEKIQHADKEHEALRRSRIAIDEEVKRLHVAVSGEMALVLKVRQSELVAQIVAAGREFVETMRREKALHDTLVNFGDHVGSDVLPSVVFYGLLTAEDNFERFNTWVKDLRRDGFAV